MRRRPCYCPGKEKPYTVKRPMKIRDVIVIFHFHYWRIPSEAVNKNNHLPQWFYPAEEVNIAFEHLC
jgi:hypothetical protein